MEKRIGPYRILSELGRGGMGVVHKAHDDALNRDVAIKMMAENVAQDQSYSTRFRREARSAAALSHPNIVQIYQIGEHLGRSFFVMEYVEGQSLLDLIAEQGAVPPRRAAEILRQAANGLAAAHDRGVIHRDIKPGNVMITPSGTVKITDFGLALMPQESTRLTATGSLMGTPGYLSPEQLGSDEIDHRTDIYSLGMTYYEMLTGEMPFKADSPFALVAQILEAEPPSPATLNPDVDDESVAILGKMIAKKRDDRFRDCHELIRSVDAYLARGASVRSTAHGEREVLTPRTRADLASRETSPETMPTVVVATPPPPFPPSPPLPQSVLVGQAEGNETGHAAVPSALVVAPPSAMSVTAEPATRPTRSRGPWPLILAAVALLVLLGVAATAAGLALFGSRLGSLRSMVGLGARGASAERVAERGVAPAGADLPGAPRAGTAAGAAAPFAAADSTVEAVPGGPSSESWAPAEEASRSEGAAGAAVASGEGAPVLEALTARRQATASQPPTAPRHATSPPDAPPVVAPREQVPPATPPQSAPALPAPPPPVALPVEPLVAVIGGGEPLLASAAEDRVVGELAGAGLRLADPKGTPLLHDLLTSGNPVALHDLAPQLRDRGIDVVVLAWVEFLGERELHYMGRSDLAITSRLEIRAYLLAEEEALAPAWTQRIEYTQISAEREAERALQGVSGDLAAAIRGGWGAYRRRAGSGR